MTENPTARFAALLAPDAGEPPLDEAALLVAAHALPALDIEAERGRLDEISGGLRSSDIDGLRKRLFEDLGFVGDRSTYDDARNSLLPSVLDRRSGIPLTLAIVAIEVGRRAGVGLVGVGMPGHFLVRSAEDDTRFLDVFDRGAEIDPDGCRRIFERLHDQLAWNDAYLAPVGTTTMVTRLLANLAGAYRRSGDRSSLAWAIELRLLLPGAADRDSRELALLHGAVGRYAAAADVLEATGVPRDRAAAARMRARLN